MSVVVFRAWTSTPLQNSINPPPLSLFIHTSHFHFSLSPNKLSFPLSRYPFPPYFPNKSSYIIRAKKKNSQLKPLSKPTIIEDDDDDDDDEEEEGEGGFTNGELVDNEDDDFFEDDYDVEEAETSVGDGAGGGGVSLAGISWDKKVLSIAEDILLSFDGDLKIYAFKTFANSAIRIRIEKLSNRSGSPGMDDIEAFSRAYRAQLDEAEQAGLVPANLTLEVSSPGLERVVQIPQDLDRFKDRPMYVKYVIEDETTTGACPESDGVFRLVSFDLESSSITWGLADVKINRGKAGKGRPLNKKQKEWRLDTPFHTLRLVRLYSDI